MELKGGPVELLHDSHTSQFTNLLQALAAEQKACDVGKVKKIPEPDGTADDDYSLQIAMSLGGDDKTYTGICTSDLLVETYGKLSDIARHVFHCRQVRSQLQYLVGQPTY